LKEHLIQRRHARRKAQSFLHARFLVAPAVGLRDARRGYAIFGSEALQCFSSPETHGKGGVEVHYLEPLELIRDRVARIAICLI